MKKHLLYHMAPIKNPMLDFNLEQLEKYWAVFDGRKVININQAAGLLRPDRIEPLLAKYHLDGCEIIYSGNDKTRETRPFVEKLLPTVEHEPGITFFAHLKGSTRPESSACRKWAEYMYRFNLQDARKVEAALSHHAVAGIFKTGPCGTTVPCWHYSGTFFWFRNDILFLRKWRDIDLDRFGTEAYPARMFETHEAACLAYGNVGGNVNLYQNETWERIEKGDLQP